MKGKNTTAVATRIADSKYLTIKSMAEARNMTISEFLKLIVDLGLKALDGQPQAEESHVLQKPGSQLELALESAPAPSEPITNGVRKINSLLKMAGDKWWSMSDLFDWLGRIYGKRLPRDLTNEELDDALRLFEREPERERP
jgi:hypothetical protein